MSTNAGHPPAPTPAPRCALIVPASDPHKVAKALASTADQVVLDLEDAIAVGAKDSARQAAVATLSWALDHPNHPDIAVRVNAAGTPWCDLDIVACASQPALGSIVLPKVESAGDLAFVERLLAGSELRAPRTEPTTIQALIETAAGLSALREITTASDRLRSIIIGYADLAASLCRTGDPSEQDWSAIQDQIVTAARAARLEPIDGPCLFIAADAALEEAALQARGRGFSGKWVIHPAQIEATTAAFAPTPEEIAWARGVLDTLSAAQGAGVGATARDGQMLDEAIALRARHLLAASTRPTPAGLDRQATP